MDTAQIVYSLSILVILTAVAIGLAKLKKALKRYHSRLCSSETGK